MLGGTKSALTATQKQLSALYRQAGHAYTPRQVWERMGATPMIGQNDVPGETFSLDVTEPGFALGYVFDIVLRGPAETAMETPK